MRSGATLALNLKTGLLYLPLLKMKQIRVQWNAHGIESERPILMLRRKLLVLKKKGEQEMVIRRNLDQNRNKEESKGENAECQVIKAD